MRKIDRLLKYLEYKGITENKATVDCGLSVGLIGKAKAGRSDLGNKAIEKILAFYQDLNHVWLLTGEGPMLKAPETSEAPVAKRSLTSGRPYYDVDFLGGFDLVLNDQTRVPEYNIDFPPYNREGVVWCNITGHSMEPEISHGDIIAVREIRGWQDFLAFGEVYAIVTRNDMRTVKIIRKGDDDDTFRLVPVNPHGYDIQQIRKEVITRIYEVIGCMKNVIFLM